ncbi:MAG: ABC transporter permease, partial [Firmicutes bacterium]|nr:ABC transporter permease [Bacillota bacterium]
VDVDAFSGAITVNIDPDQLRDLMMSMMATNRTSYESNLSKLNYADKGRPSSILIYPKDFNSKTALTAMIDEYNRKAREAEEDDKVITYTDYVATLMSSVTTIVDTISYVLIAFVAISLVVSSIMIGIITYISVLERTKEIGILRAIGASKRNVSQVFNAETFIIGLLSGLIGVGVSLLLLIPGNAVIHNLAGNTDINAFLPPFGALALIIISVILTLIGGLIPSRAAAKKDPVKALRTE